MTPQITVLDAGGQYCHLIARKVRDLGVYAEVRASDTPAAELEGRKGIIISGGPSSVYEASSPRIKEWQASKTGLMPFNFRLLLAGLAYSLLTAVRRLGLTGTELARAQAGTIRLKLLKIGAVVRR